MGSVKLLLKSLKCPTCGVEENGYFGTDSLENMERDDEKRIFELHNISNIQHSIGTLAVTIEGVMLCRKCKNPFYFSEMFNR
jgi:hypothetical protein